MSGRVRQAWDEYVLPRLIEKACRSSQILEERKRVVPRAEGRVLEVGIGSGLNLAFYDPERVEAIVGVDPSAPLLDRARARSREGSIPTSFVLAPAENLPFETRSFDSVVLTYTLCSVDRPFDALTEMRRVLRPGGRLHFIEHGLAPDASVKRWQRLITPAWRQIGGNCHLTRDVTRELASAGFRIEESNAAYAPEGSRLFSFTYEGIAR